MHLHLEGQMRLSELVAAHGASRDSEGAIRGPEEAREILRRLSKDHIVAQVRTQHMHSLADNMSDVRTCIIRTEYGSGRDLKGKQKLELEHKVHQQIRNLQTGQASTPDTNGVGTVKRKRGKDPHPPASKSKKLKREIKWEDAMDDPHPIPQSTARDNDAAIAPDDDLAIGLNVQRLEVVMRDLELARICKARLGSTSADLYHELLQMNQVDRGRCKLDLPPTATADDQDDTDAEPRFTTLRVAQQISRMPRFQDLLHSTPVTLEGGEVQLHRRKKRRRVGDGECDDPMDDKSDLNGLDVSDLLEMDGVDEDIRTQIAAVQAQLEILAEDPASFITPVDFSTRGDGSWYVDYPSLVRLLAQEEIEAIILARYDESALRLVRILNDQGKLDEKQLSQLSFIKESQMRISLLALRDAGLLELQELARDKAMTANRSLFLWFYDQNDAQYKILEECYQAMSRLMQRMKLERSKESALLAKAQRTDVKGNEEKYLTADERARLKSWDRTEGMLMGQVGRIDRVVAILRDF